MTGVLQSPLIRSLKSFDAASDKLQPNQSRTFSWRAQRGFTGHILQIFSVTVLGFGVGNTPDGGAMVSKDGALPLYASWYAWEKGSEPSFFPPRE
jgi:hypothetical protein